MERREASKRQNRIFWIIAILFTALMIGFAIHFASMTTSPWNKKKFDQKYRVKDRND